MAYSLIASAKSDHYSCLNCLTRKYCLARAVSGEELSLLQAGIGRQQVLKKGEHLFYQGEKLQSLAIVRSGSVKTYYVADDGVHQITGFHFPGALLGANSFDSGAQIVCAEVLETTSVCVLDCEAFDRLCQELPSFRYEFYRAVGREITHDKKHMLVVGKFHAEQRLADFILRIAGAKQSQGLEHREFTLTMSKTDIANYLGIALETMSRLFARFQVEGFIHVKNRVIRILNPDGLQTLAGAGYRALPLAKSA